MNYHQILQPSPTIIRNNPATNWMRYQGPQQIPYQQQHQFIASSIPSFRQPMAPRHQPQKIIQRPSNAIVIIDPRTRNPIELVKFSSATNQRTNRLNHFQNDGYYSKDKFEGKNDSPINTNTAVDQEKLKHPEPPVVPVTIVEPVTIIEPDDDIIVELDTNDPIVVLENVVNDEEKKPDEELNVILSEPSNEVKQCLASPIIATSIDDQIVPSIVKSKPPKAVKSKVPAAPKPSNEVKPNKLSKHNEKNKRRRATTNKQPYLKSKKGVTETTPTELCVIDKEIEIELCAIDKEIETKPKETIKLILRYSIDDLILFLNSETSMKKPRLDSRFLRIKSNQCNLMKTLKADLNNLNKSNIDICEVNSPIVTTQSCPSLFKYPPGIIRISLSDTKVLKGVENAWTPKCRQVNSDVSDGLDQEIVMKFRSVLNKLCPENFNKMLEELKDLEMNSSSVLNQCIRLLFEKAIADVCFTPTYALMCASIREFQKDKCSFLTHLVSYCQEEFERFHKGFDNNTDDEGKTKFHRDTIGTVKFIGELYNIKIVDDKVTGECIKMLMDPQTIGNISLECLCNLLKTIGSRIEENNEITKLIDDCYKQLDDIITNKTIAITPRIKFAIMDLLELKTSCWKERRIIEVPKKLNQIADEMQKKDDENAELTRKFCQNRISRNHNDIGNKISTTKVQDQRYKDANQSETKLDQLNVNTTVKIADTSVVYNNNTSTETKINVKKVRFEITNDEIKKTNSLDSFRRNRNNRSFDRNNLIIPRFNRTDNRNQRTDDKVTNIVPHNPVVNNRYKDSPRPITSNNFQHNHHNACNNYESESNKNMGSNSNRQQWNNRGYNNRKDIPRFDHNQHGDQANVSSRSITKRSYHEPIVIRESWRSKV